MRVTNAPARKRRHKKILKLAKGFRWGRKNVYTLAKNAVMKAGQHAYRDRRRKKRDFRRLWITRVSSSVRALGHRYSEFMNKATAAKMVVNRKMLADLAATEPKVFSALVKKVMS
jgi:large subunit ribosomal protein L20